MTSYQPYEYNERRPSAFGPTSPALTTFERYAWVDDAACGEPGAPHMFPHASDSVGIELAKLCCAVCPVRDECREQALSNSEPWGVWGGLSEEDRRLIKRRESRARQAAARRAGTLATDVNVVGDIL